MNKLTEMLQQDFMLNVLAGTALIGALCAYLGVFIVLRRAVFVGAALAQISSLGVALALLTCGWLGYHAHDTDELPLQPFALVMTMGASAMMALQYRERKLPRETVIGFSYVAASALAVLAVAASPHAEAQMLNLLFGNVLTIQRGDVFSLAALVLAVGAMHALFFKEFIFVSVDADMAMAVGVRARFWNVLLFLTIGITISLAIRAAGALVVFNFLVLPAATALLIGKNLRAVFAIAVGVGLVAIFAGIAVSYVMDWPTGPTIVAVNAALLGLVWIFRRR